MLYGILGVVLCIYQISLPYRIQISILSVFFIFVGLVIKRHWQVLKKYVFSFFRKQKTVFYGIFSAFRQESGQIEPQRGGKTPPSCASSRQGRAEGTEGRRRKSAGTSAGKRCRFSRKVLPLFPESAASFCRRRRHFTPPALQGGEGGGGAFAKRPCRLAGRAAGPVYK